MNIPSTLANLFRKDTTTVETTTETEPTLEQELAAAEARLAALQVELMETRLRVVSGEADEETHLRATILPQRVQAAAAVRDAAADRLHQARIEAERAEFRADVHARMERIGELHSRLQFEANELERLQVNGTTPHVDLEAEYGVPHDYGRRLGDGLHNAAPDADFHCDWIEGRKTPAPTPKRRGRARIVSKTTDIYGNAVRNPDGTVVFQ